MLKRYLLAPGPTPVPPEVLLAMARPMFHHRAPEFDKVFAEVRDGLKWLFQTKNNVLMLAASGTGGMEGPVSNFLPPGLAFVSVSDKAWQLAEKAKNTAFYFNFKKEHENQQKNQTAYTPAVSLIVGLQEVLKMMKAEGLEGVFGRQAMLAKAMREGVQGAGLSLFPKESPSDALTAISAPEGVDGQAIYKNLRVQYGMTAAGGQDHLKGKIFRLSHMGYMDRFDIIMGVAAVEMVLKGLGHPVMTGSGVAKTREIQMA